MIKSIYAQKREKLQQSRTTTEAAMQELQKVRPHSTQRSSSEWQGQLTRQTSARVLSSLAVSPRLTSDHLSSPRVPFSQHVADLFLPLDSTCDERCGGCPGEAPHLALEGNGSVQRVLTAGPVSPSSFMIQLALTLFHRSAFTGLATMLNFVSNLTGSEPMPGR